MESVPSQFLGEISSSFRLGVCWCPCDGVIGFTLGPSQFGVRNMWLSQNPIVFEVASGECLWVGPATSQGRIPSPLGQEEGKIDISFLNLIHAHLKCRTLTHLIVIHIQLLLFQLSITLHTKTMGLTYTWPVSKDWRWFSNQVLANGRLSVWYPMEQLTLQVWTAQRLAGPSHCENG